MKIDTLRKAMGKSPERSAPSMYQLQVSVPKDYEQKLESLESSFFDGLRELRGLIADLEQRQKDSLDERITTTSGSILVYIRRIASTLSELESKTKSELGRIDDKIGSISWKHDIEKTVADLKSYADNVEQRIREAMSTLPEPFDPREEIEKMSSDLVTRREAEEEVKRLLDSLGSDFKKMQKNVAEMGYSLQLFANGTLVGTTPALNLAAGSGVNLASTFVNGIPKVTITATGSSGTLVDGEVPVDSGDHTNFTIAHTPLANTFKLFRGGARQQGGGIDFTLTGTALVLSKALVTGEILLCDYSY